MEAVMRRNYSNRIQKAQAHLTYKNAVEAKCAECMGCDADYLEPDFRNSIRNCSAYKCPLYPVRPYAKKSPK